MWFNRCYHKYEFTYGEFDGSISEVRMYLLDINRVSAHHFYLIGKIDGSNDPCIYRLDRVRGKFRDLRTNQMLRPKAFLQKNYLFK